MKIANLFRARALAAALVLAALLLLGACAVAPTPATGGAAPGAPRIVVGEPAPGLAGTVSLDCKTDADCAIKDVGSCCGYNPRCVNKDSATFPGQVKAQCANEGRVGVCGFPAIDGCVCKAGKCAGVAASDSLVQ